MLPKPKSHYTNQEKRKIPSIPFPTNRNQGSWEKRLMLVDSEAKKSSKTNEIWPRQRHGGPYLR